MTANPQTELLLHFDRLKTETDSDDPAPVPVRVHFDGADTETFDFVNPLTDKDLKDLRWYLESYWVWPSEIDDKRAREVEARLPKWGKALFDAVFYRSSEAMRLFGRFDDDHAAGRRLTIDTNEPRILRLPWELLRDEGGYLFSKQPPVSVLRRMKQTRHTRISAFEPPVHILMVTCRPDGVGLVDPRSIATPLLDALEGIPEQVEVEFLRPPTLAALDQRLRDPDQPRVHIVHFDGHGVYDKGVGLGFLLFEDEQHQEHLVDAEQLGTLLNESGIPLMVLNACQSAQPDERNPFGSVASRLIESGLGGVVAMNYSVLVETAKRFTAEFYGALARGGSAGVAMDAARRNLFRDTKRLTIRRPATEEAANLHLQDWFLPALYQQAAELVPFQPAGKPMPPAKKATLPQQAKSEHSGFPPAPLHGFHGRARELLDLERAFAVRPIVVLHGFGGQGKTALATQTAEWFTRTGLFERAAFFSFESGASLEYVLNELGGALVAENFQIYSGDKAVAIAQALREQSALVVFDNFESALPQGNAPLSDLPALLDTAAGWFGACTPGGSRLLVTTRNSEIPHPAFTPGRSCRLLELTGLAAADALDLTAAILETHSLPRPPYESLKKLLAFLDGHPLSLQLALPQLRRYTAEQLVAEYQSILPQMKTGAGRERNESLEVSLKFSLDRLGADAWTWLTRLAIFEGGAMEDMLLKITKIPAGTWQALKPQLIATALIRSEDIPGVEKPPFIHFHPTLAPYLRGLEDGTESAEDGSAPAQPPILERYWRAYYAFASYLYQIDKQHAIQVRAVALRELPNLKRALQRALAAGAMEEAVELAASIEKFLDNFGRWRERDELAAQVEKAVKTQGRGTEGEITKFEYVQEIQRGERLHQHGRLSEAEQIFRTLLIRLEGTTAYDTRYDQVIALTKLGRCRYNQGRPAQAVDCHFHALELAQGLEQTQDVRNQIGNCHSEVANALRDLGQYSKAREHYEKGLAIAQREGNTQNVAINFNQFGTLARMQGDLKEARQRHLDALDLFQRLGEDESQAIAWHQLGIVALEAQDWDEAERCYKQSLAIAERLGDLQGVAGTCNQLAVVAENAGRPQEAERWYLRAIEIYEGLEYPKKLTTVYNNLADLYCNQDRLDKAETYARRSLDINETLDLSSQQWNNYNLLAKISQKRKHATEARDWQRKAQEARLMFEAGSQADTTSSSTIRRHADKWHDIVARILRVCQSGQPDEELDQFLDKLAGGDAGKNLSLILRRILSGERGLELFDGLDDVDSAIVRRVLKGLLQEGEAPSAPQEEKTEEKGPTLPQLLDQIERAAGGDAQLDSQLFATFQQMTQSDDPVMSALGGVLLRVLLGERNPPNLERLPDEVASAIRGLLGRLRNKG